MKRAEIKQQAKDTLKGRWGKAVGLYLVYNLLIGAIGMVLAFLYGIGPLVLTIISVPLSFGYIGVFLRFVRNENADYLDFFKLGFDNFGKAWSIVGYTILKLIGYYIAYVVCIFAFIGFIIAAVSAESMAMLIIGAVIISLAYLIICFLLATQSYYFVLTNYIGNDMTEMSGRDVVAKSKELMKGHRWEFFVLQLSFIGWGILALLTCGIGFFWLEPYMQVTYVKYYENLAYGNTKNVDEEVIREQ